MTRLTLAMCALALFASAPALASDLPAVCLRSAPMGDMAMGDMGMGDMAMGDTAMGDTAMGDMAMGDMAMGDAQMAPAGPDPAHADLMAGMGVMNADMMAGGTAADIDVAFVCSMIPHHQGAIAMAKAELAHGDDPWARKLAETIIAAQEKEIADMKDWLIRQPQ